MQGIVDSVDGSGYHLMFAQTGYSEMLEIDVVESVLPFRPAGVVFTGVVRADKTRQALQKLGIPVMEMWGNRPDPIDMLVGSSSYDAGRLMGEHFGERGFRRVAYSGHTIERTAQLATDASHATEAQASSAAQLLETASKMTDLAQQIAEAAKENALGASEITRAAEKMNQLTKQMLDATVEQKQGGDLVVMAIDSIALVARQHLAAVEETTSAAKALARESESLKQEVETFRI